MTAFHLLLCYVCDACCDVVVEATRRDCIREYDAEVLVLACRTDHRHMFPSLTFDILYDADIKI